MSSGPSCSDGSLAVEEPMAGTSPHAVGWVALEQNGPWGARAFTQSHLDPRVGRAIESVAEAHGVRPALIRRPGRHADPHDAREPRRVLVAHTRPAASWLLEATVVDPEELLSLDWAAVADGDLAAVRRSLASASPTSQAHLLVCTNAKRDVCCAVKGRPVALGAARHHPEQVWEVTHTSGHRFAPTAVLLPAGTLHGRLDVAAADALLAAAARDETVLGGSRGRSTWPPPAQAAELAVREHTGLLGLDDLAVEEHTATGDGAWTTVLRHADGRGWQVRVEARSSDVLRAESCGKALKPLTWFTEGVHPAPIVPAHPG